MSENVNSLLFNYQVININDSDGKIVKEIKFRKLSALRTIRIANEYDDLQKKLMRRTKGEDMEAAFNTDLRFTERYLRQVVDLCLKIIRPNSFIEKIKQRLSGKWITKRYLLNSFDIIQLTDFINLVIKPILGKPNSTDNKKKQ